MATRCLQVSDLYLCDPISDCSCEVQVLTFRYSVDYPGAASFAGRRFKKEDITAALWLRNTSANGYEQLFKPADMSKIPALQRWYDDLTGSEAATFEHLSIQKFIAWRDKRLKPSRSAKATSKASRSTTLKRKERESESESDEDIESEVSETPKKPKKVRRRLNSESLDD